MLRKDKKIVFTQHARQRALDHFISDLSNEAGVRRALRKTAKILNEKVIIRNEECAFVIVETETKITIITVLPKRHHAKNPITNKKFRQATGNL